MTNLFRAKIRRGAIFRPAEIFRLTGVALRCPSCLIDSAHLVCGSGSMKLSNVRPSVCLSVRSIIRPPNAAAAAGFAAVGPGATRSIDRLLHGRAWQQMRAVLRCQLTQEAKHRLVVIALLLLCRLACAECKDAGGLLLSM